MHPIRRSMVAAAIAAFLFPSLALGHATLVGSTPSDGATIATLPTFIVLTFDEALRDDSSFEVLDAAGTVRATGAVRLDPLPPGMPDPSDPKGLIAATPNLRDGTYRVRWTAITADDGAVERGEFEFTVALDASATAERTDPDGIPSAVPTAIPSSPTPTVPGADPPGTAPDAVVPIAIVAVLVAGLLGVLLRRRGPA